MKTIDLELAKELQSVCKEKNVTMPESYHSWYEYRKGVYCLRNTDNGKTVYKYITPAYTLDELLEWLPNKIEKGTTTYFKTLLHNYNKEYLAYYDDSNCGYIPSTSFFQFDPNPANAACKLLIYLIKDGLI